MRFHPSLPYRPDSGGWHRCPALVAAVAGDDGELQGVHRTWLDPRRSAKAPVEHPRNALGRLHGFAVRCGEPASASSLLVGERIETVLSLVIVLPDGVLRSAGPSPTFVAAALSAGGLGTFVPPVMTARLIVAQDSAEAEKVRKVVSYVEEHITDDRVVGRALRRVARKGARKEIDAFTAAVIRLLRTHSEPTELS